MKTKRGIQLFLTMVAFLFLFGCAAKEPVNFGAFTPAQFDLDKVETKVDNFLVIMDASSSMRHENKFETAKTVVERLNMTIPELGQTAGFRTFGHDPSVCKDKTKLFYGMEAYTTAGMADGLAGVVKPGGLSRLDKALEAAQTDLEGQAGVYNAVIVVSDGIDMTDVQAQARHLKTYLALPCASIPCWWEMRPKAASCLRTLLKSGNAVFSALRMTF